MYSEGSKYSKSPDSSKKLTNGFLGCLTNLEKTNGCLDKIKAGEIPKLYYSSKTDYLFFEDDYLPIGYAQAALLFTIIFPTIGIIVWRKELDNDIRTM